jgi:hypothetical protein
MSHSARTPSAASSGRWSRRLLTALFVTGLLIASAASATGEARSGSALLPSGAALATCGRWDGGLYDAAGGCSTVYATDGRQMLAGNNEDSVEPLAKVWFVPAQQGTFGLVLFGYGNYRAQGGMNDQGLFFDLLTVSTELPIPLEGKQLWPGTNYLIYDAIATCATVACVVDLFERYYDAESWSMQAFFGDATGESAIIEPQAILRQHGGYQVATNFLQSRIPPEQDPASACPRYRAASEMLAGAPALSVEYIRDVMAAVHQDGPYSLTIYTNVYDLANRLVYLYYFSDYEHVAVIDLEEELAKGAHAYDLPALFPPNPAAQEFFATAMQGYDNLIRSRRVEIDPAFLAAYVGEYAPSDSGPVVPGAWLSVAPYGNSLMMIFPDAHRYELFPQSETSFFVVTWNKMNERFQVQFEVEFGLDEATGRVTYMDFVFGPADSVRNDRLGNDSFVPYVPEAVPTSTTTAPPTTTTAPTTTLPVTTTVPATTTSVPATTTSPSTMPQPAGTDAGFPWAWMILPAALLAAGVGWAVGRQRAGGRP